MKQPAREPLLCEVMIFSYTRIIYIFSTTLTQHDKEWLAYHYHVANLRHVIIASDPDSMTRPLSILDRWKGKMTVDLWQESRFLPPDFHQKVLDRATGNQRSKSLVLTNHRERQRRFNLECLREFKRQNRGWILMIDTDEYLKVNPLLYNNNEKKAGYWDIPPVSEPGSVYAVLNTTMIPNPTFEKVTTPCVHVHRTQFSAGESLRDKVENLVPKGFLGSNFQTLRWRKYGTKTARYKTKFGSSCSIRRNFPGKVVIDLRRLQPIDLRHDVNTGNPHAPLAACSQNVYWDPSDTPVLAHHYMGTPEQWNYRAGDKRGRFCVHQHGRRTMHSFVHFIYLLMHLLFM